MIRSMTVLLALTALTPGLALTATAGEQSTFERLIPSYESIRLALLNDETDGITDDAIQIEHIVQELEAQFSPEAGGIRAADADKLEATLPAIREAAVDVGEAASIEDTRAAFGKLSKAMVKYRRLLPSPVPVVAFCSMAQQVWLQPKGELGNPYYGQSMATCGEIVSD